MRTCLGVIAFISLAAGLFLLIPLVFIHIPDWRTYRAGEMVITDMSTVRTGADSDSHATGHILGDGRKAVFDDIDLLRLYLGHSRLMDTIEAGPPPAVPVWYTDRGKAIARFGKGENYPDIRKNELYSLRNTFFFFIPALIVLMMYFYDRWKKHFVWLLIGHLYTSSLAAQTQQNLSDFRETIPLSIQISSVCQAYAHDYGPEGLPIVGCFRTPESVALSYPEQVFESMMSSTSAAWDSLHTYGGMAQVQPKPASHYAAVASRDTSASRFRLLYKLVIHWPNGSQRAFVKFRFEDDASGARPLGLYELIADGDRWKLYPGSINLLLFMAFAQTPTPLLQAMLLHPATLPPELATALSPCYAGSGAFSLETYMRLLAQWAQDPAKTKLLTQLQEDLNW